MTLVDRIAETANALPEQEQRQVLDFTLFLKAKEAQQLDAMMDKIIEDNKPALEELAK